MTLDDILNELNLRGYSTNAAVTQQTLYSKISADQLYSNTNRLNAGWGRGKIVLATFSSAHSKSDFINKWKELVGKYQDQYLCLEVNNSPSMWEFYDWNGQQIGYSDIFPPVSSMKRISSLQTIFYGAPGTGKSNTIKREVEDKGRIHFRTTFHPDSDYSTFVGCYKPTKEETTPAKQPILDYDTLVDKFKEYLNVANVNITKACTLFGYDYHDSIIEIQNYGKKVLDLVNDAYKSNTSYDSVVRGGMACYESHPTTNNTNSITYQFVPQAFTKAYCEAWNNYNPEGESEPVFLIIEEINRGNCAQIFGDIFQLLDRKDGFSEYPIDADEDLKKFLLNGTKEDGTPWLANKDGIKDGKLCLPANLHIWATMNTSDQSLFPIDSAFKRRWDWKYVPINTRKESWSIKVNGTEYSWSDFLEKINAEIDVVTHSEDKKLGFYFCKAENGVISAERFVSKVLFYIWNDVFKDYGFEKDIFNDTDGKLSFGKFYQENGDIQEDKVALFLKNLVVEITGAAEDETDIEYDTTDASKAEHKETLVAVTINGERLTADGMTQFDLYLNTIKKIGVDKVGPVLETMKYRRKGSPMATKDQVQSLLESDGYSYVEADGYYFVKGSNGYTLIRILEDLKRELNIDMEIEYR